MMPSSVLLQQNGLAPTNGAPGTNSSSSKKDRNNLNVQDVLLGNVRIKPWYPSFYPEELVGRRTEKLFVCQWCFKYSREVLPSVGHAAVCSLREAGPPGVSIYEQDDISILELDGEDYKLFTQNLSLFAKLFLDTKSVFYDVSTFLYYLLVYRDPSVASQSGPGQVVGFFSKEKLSWDNNNLACILVFPPWQRKGFGQALMETSYVLSKRDESLGGPEKPLSEPGKRGYLRYWSGSVARCLVRLPARKAVTVKDISDDTYIALDDVVMTLKEMGVLEQRKKGNIRTIVDRVKVRAWMEANGVKMEPPVNHEAFVIEDLGSEGMEE